MSDQPRDPDGPKPFLNLQGSQPSERPSKVNRVTTRICLVREMGGTESQVFPPSGAFEVQIHQRTAALVRPSMELSNDVIELDTGWVEEPTVVAVYNSTKWLGVSNPTEEQRAEIAKCIVLIGFSDGCLPQHTCFALRLRPGETQPLLLSPGIRVYLTAEAGNPVVSLFAV